jgi:hypothetical protein
MTVLLLNAAQCAARPAGRGTWRKRITEAGKEAWGVVVRSFTGPFRPALPF